jgi:XTP/dITP diphosphohydrolase
MKLLLGTYNKHKVQELRELLSIDVLSCADFEHLPEAIEDKETFEGNALLKAQFYHQQTTLPCLADDSGLCVNALDDLPGVYSARYAGPNATDSENIAKLLSALQEISDRRAYYRCVLAYVDAKGNAALFEGTLHGTIATSPAGNNGFGYDPVFIPQGYHQTLAELDIKIKQSISHRALALHKFKDFFFNTGL